MDGAPRRRPVGTWQGGQISKQKQEGKKRPVLVDVDKTFQMDGVKYAKYLLAFK